MNVQKPIRQQLALLFFSQQQVGIGVIGQHDKAPFQEKRNRPRQPGKGANRQRAARRCAVQVDRELVIAGAVGRKLDGLDAQLPPVVVRRSFGNGLEEGDGELLGALGDWLLMNHIEQPVQPLGREGVVGAVDVGFYVDAA